MASNDDIFAEADTSGCSSGAANANGSFMITVVAGCDLGRTRAAPPRRRTAVAASAQRFRCGRAAGSGDHSCSSGAGVSSTGGDGTCTVGVCCESGMLRVGGRGDDAASSAVYSCQALGAVSGLTFVVHRVCVERLVIGEFGLAGGCGTHMRASAD